ncbi:leucyl/phenylalanyl-tRNA--protein transferase [Kushneria phosphatilytica]|uniref:Leucyl/phenylalanyl-tRNA--protein transferase n=1 Tax=Kushneria phosphatilytica TaxID=657387 RepID=A0A1S1NUP9_9GAMM|nr:leucyl/phenylalanyl-tRNA--protein transferase [Kushneria phosphatilytica]OHV09937.1 leucyl/phenylalanyl-tRNA--protein transferase [Kushneria phosphatilytica]QEL11608.1 leucyl/phenylalanyl-tRNA--protein transferase [Kushneria phosphatilytica]
MVPWLAALPIQFPPVDQALREPDGLLAAGGALTPDWLLAAYVRGIFPWFGESDPILWWSPDPRLVLFPAELRVRRSLAKRWRNGGFSVTLDCAFDSVIHHCGALRAQHEGTWITDRIRAAYSRLHRLGYAHSVEVWQSGTLAGGLYGIALGRVFFGESMFSLQPDASKIALAELTRYLQALDFTLIDCQVHTDHLVSMGAREIDRNEFIRYLEHDAWIDHPPAPWAPI